MWIVYVLKSLKSGKRYVGMTQNLVERIASTILENQNSHLAICHGNWSIMKTLRMLKKHGREKDILSQRLEEDFLTQSPVPVPCPTDAAAVRRGFRPQVL